MPVKQRHGMMGHVLYTMKAARQAQWEHIPTHHSTTIYKFANPR